MICPIIQLSDPFQDMHDQLSSQSNWIDQLVDEMKNYVSANPQSQACQSLLDQVKQVFFQPSKFLVGHQNF